MKQLCCQSEQLMMVPPTHFGLLCPWAIIPKSSVHHSNLVFQVGNAVAKQPVDENNNALTSKTSEVHSE